MFVERRFSGCNLVSFYGCAHVVKCIQYASLASFLLATPLAWLAPGSLVLALY